MVAFLDWLNTWYKKLTSSSFKDLEIDPSKTVLISVDMIVGFCHEGPLASKEVVSIIPNLVSTFNKSYKFGIKHFLLLQDTHSENAVEFAAYPPHCIKGTKESETIPELKNLPFSNLFTIIEKNSLSPAFSDSFLKWMKAHSEVENFIIVGNCTDLCVHTVAMHLRLEANARDLKRRVIVVADSVATYNMPVEAAQKVGALPHDSNLLHKLFLYHMKLNGVEVVKEIE